ncbi:MAG: flagellar motor protein MotB [Sphingobacterium sp.]|uniref:flagellar motor protein MotB n=1 Tax=Sphingobacterium paramultivorum TaxID=2886510 RepID=UPI00129D0F63|nr:flagellar motor protein MotB [Sphingobacterium paramultivorum]
MAKKEGNNIFWVSFSDLMTSLFFIVLVLFVVTYVNNRNTIIAQDEQLQVYKEVEDSLMPLKNNSSFRYEDKYKRFLLNFEVKFKPSAFEIQEGNLEHYAVTRAKVIDAGKKLKEVLDAVVRSAKEQNRVDGEKVSYLVIISGYASKLYNADTSPLGRKKEYELSYNRAYALAKFWKAQGIDFEEQAYGELIDLQLSGNGWGGVGRDQANEDNNQRFIIQIVPKISNRNL